MIKIKRISYAILLTLIVVISISLKIFIPNDAFVESIEEKLNAGQAKTILSEATDFTWSEVCFFTKADSAPFSAYNSYSEYINKQKIDITKLKHRDYGSVFLFKTADGYIQYGNKKDHFTIQGKDYWLRSKNKEYTKSLSGCLRSPVMLEADNTDLLFIYEGER